MGSLHLKHETTPKAKPRTIFYIVSIKDNSGKYRQVKIGTGYQVKPDQWSTRGKGQVKAAKHPQAQEINEALTHFTEQVDLIVAEAKDKGHTVTSAYIRKALKDTPQHKKQKPKAGFFEAFDIFLDEYIISSPTNTQKSAKGCRNKLQAFQKATRYPVEFETINADFLHHFVGYLRDKDGLRDSTIQHQVKMLKKFMRWAGEREYHETTHYQGFKVKAQRVNSHFALEAQELQTLRQLDLSDNPRLERVRDRLLFMCDTGMRYSDFVALTKDNIQQATGPDGQKEYRLSYRTEKTKTPIRAILADEPARGRYPLSIALRYLAQVREDNFVFPPISNSKFNKYLKELAELAKLTRRVQNPIRKGVDLPEIVPIHQAIATHTGRRTFVTQRALQGWSIPEIQVYTGHLSQGELEAYIKATDGYKLEISRRALDKGK